MMPLHDTPHFLPNSIFANLVTLAVLTDQFSGRTLSTTPNLLKKTPLKLSKFSQTSFKTQSWKPMPLNEKEKSSSVNNKRLTGNLRKSFSTIFMPPRSKVSPSAAPSLGQRKIYSLSSALTWSTTSAKITRQIE